MTNRVRDHEDHQFYGGDAREALAEIQAFIEKVEADGGDGVKLETDYQDHWGSISGVIRIEWMRDETKVEAKERQTKAARNRKQQLEICRRQAKALGLEFKE